VTQAGLLETTGKRDAVYHFQCESISTAVNVFGPATRFSAPSSPNLPVSFPILVATPPEFGRQLPDFGRQLPEFD
jgi:hypothetical protein